MRIGFTAINNVLRRVGLCLVLVTYDDDHHELELIRWRTYQRRVGASAQVAFDHTTEVARGVDRERRDEILGKMTRQWAEDDATVDEILARGKRRIEAGVHDEAGWSECPRCLLWAHESHGPHECPI